MTMKERGKRKREREREEREREKEERHTHTHTHTHIFEKLTSCSKSFHCPIHSGCTTLDSVQTSFMLF